MRLVASTSKTYSFMHEMFLKRELLTRKKHSDTYYDFGSGAWFLKTQCSPEIQTGLAGGSLAGWQAYITGCVQTQANPERQAYWQRAMDALSKSV